MSLCSEDPATPARPLPRASTDESYAEIPTAEKEKELADILGQIQQLNVILSSRRFVDCSDSISLSFEIATRSVAAKGA